MLPSQWLALTETITNNGNYIHVMWSTVCISLVMGLIGLKPNFHWVRQRRVTAAPRSPELIGNTIINESISTGNVSAACQQRLSSGSRAAALSIGSISIFDRAVSNSRQAQQSRLHQTGRPTPYRHNKTSVPFQSKTQCAAHNLTSPITS